MEYDKRRAVFVGTTNQDAYLGAGVSVGAPWRAEQLADGHVAQLEQIPQAWVHLRRAVECLAQGCKQFACRLSIYARGGC